MATRKVNNEELKTAVGKKVTECIGNSLTPSKDKSRQVQIVFRCTSNEKKAMKQFCLDKTLKLTDLIKSSIALVENGIDNGKYKVIAGRIVEA